MKVNSDYHPWKIFDEGAYAYLDTEKPQARIETGDYYIFNAATGIALHRNNQTCNCKQGRIEDLGEATIKCHIPNLDLGHRLMALMWIGYYSSFQ